MHTTRTVLATLVTTTMLSLLAGCGGDPEPVAEEPTSSAPTADSSSSPTEPGSSEPAAEVTIMIADFAYSDPGPVAPGTEITVTNEDDASHTVTADGAGDFDVTIAPGATETFTAPDEPGDYPFVCAFHANMTGTLVVG